jgi:hypothetical protein
MKYDETEKLSFLNGIEVHEFLYQKMILSALILHFGAILILVQWHFRI